MLSPTNICEKEGHRLEPVSSSSIDDKNKVFRVYICNKCGETTKVEIK